MQFIWCIFNFNLPILRTKWFVGPLWGWVLVLCQCRSLHFAHNAYSYPENKESLPDFQARSRIEPPISATHLIKALKFVLFPPLYETIMIPIAELQESLFVIGKTLPWMINMSDSNPFFGWGPLKSSLITLMGRLASRNRRGPNKVCPIELK